MPPVAIAAGIGAVGAVGSAAIGSKAAKKAAKAQATSSAQQMAAARENRDFLYNLATPDLTRGTQASDTIAGLLNIGGDPAKSAAALETFRGSTGYQDIMREGLGAVNANAYARGMGQSGAAFKALQDRGASIADQSANNYLGQLTGVANRGTAALGVVGNVGTNTVNLMNNASQAAADAKGNAALASGSMTSNALNGLLGAGMYAFGSSYGQPAKPSPVTPPWGSPGHGQPQPSPSPFPYARTFR